MPTQRRLSTVLIILVLFSSLTPLAAWGPHPVITKAALDVLPDAEKWQQALGPENFAKLTAYCWLPDQKGEDMKAYYGDDYLLFRAHPNYTEHVMPMAMNAVGPYFRRALQALRTEDPVNAARQMGPLIHFVEDILAPPHARPYCPHHNDLEYWVDNKKIIIAGYQPLLLGRTDDEALAALQKRLSELVPLSAKRADEALPLVSAPNPDRSKVEPIILESALDAARIAADTIHTVLTLGLAPQPVGAGLKGIVTAPEFPMRNDHGARVILLDSDFGTLANTDAGKSASGAWQGSYEFHNLPAGQYRIMAYRTAARAIISEPVTLKIGETARMDFALLPTEPPGNIIENPDAAIAYLPNNRPDRWRVALAITPTWSSSSADINPKLSYRCGAALKYPNARVTFVFWAEDEKKGGPPIEVKLLEGQLKPEEKIVTPSLGHQLVTVRVETDKPLAETIERVWVIPVTQEAGGQTK